MLLKLTMLLCVVAAVCPPPTCHAADRPEFAIVIGDMETLQRLLQEDPSHKDSRFGADSLDLLGWAVCFGQADIAEYLLTQDFTVKGSALKGSTLLHLAALRSPNPDIVEWLIDQGLGVDDVMTGEQSEGMTALHIAAGKGRTDVVSKLIEKGASLNPREPQAQLTPLDLAMRHCRGDIVALLVDAGAEVAPANPFGLTPEVFSVLKDCPEGSLTDKSGMDLLAPSGSQLKLVNAQPFDVVVGLRSKGKGRNIFIPSGGNVAVSVPSGEYETFFVYSVSPTELMKGEDFSLNSERAELRLGGETSGNYSITPVNE